MRLSPEHWITAGFDALVSKGPSALAAEPLACQIGTTKGSFYWHFKDVPAFHTAMIAAWETRATAHLANAVAKQGSADQRLRRFGHDILDDPSEAAMRLWALTNTDVIPTLSRRDADVLTYLNLLLRELGLGNADFARALQATLIGLPQLSEDVSVRRATYDTLVDTVLAL